MKKRINTENVSKIFAHAFADGNVVCDWQMDNDCTMDDLINEAKTTKSDGIYFFEYIDFSIYDEEEEFVELVTVYDACEVQHRVKGDYGTDWTPDDWNLDFWDIDSTKKYKYEIREGFGEFWRLDVRDEYDTLAEAMHHFNSLEGYKGTKCAWFAESNCSGYKRIPDDYSVAVYRVELDDDEEFVDEDEVAIFTYGYDQMLEEYGSIDDAPFGLRVKDMQQKGW